MKFKSWIIIKEITEKDAEKILGSKRGDPNLANAYRQASIKNHPDKGGDTEDMKKINAAFELLSGKEEPKSNENKPFRGNESYANIDYCQYVIKEKSKQNGPVKPYWFLAWDGYFFRGTFTANSNPESFDFAGMVMEKWNDSLHETKAVFVEIEEKTILLIRLDGKNVSKQNKIFQHDSFNRNPSNDQEFIQMLRSNI